MIVKELANFIVNLNFKDIKKGSYSAGRVMFYRLYWCIFKR